MKSNTGRCWTAVSRIYFEDPIALNHPNFMGKPFKLSRKHIHPYPSCKGVVTVGYASVAGDTGDSSSSAAQNASAVLFGVTLTLLGQVVQAAQAQIMFP